MEKTESETNFVSKIKKFWQNLGPGLITGASDDDPSGIATYSQAGSQFGYQTLWTALITFPLMAAIQEMCGRIGLVTGMGLTKVVKTHYPKWLIYVLSIISIPAIILNIGANLAGMGAVANLVFPSVATSIFTTFFAVLIISVLIFFQYKQLAEILKWLSLVLLLYLFIPFLVKQNLGDILVNTFLPQITFSKEFISILVAILGTTISPYLFFWEASMEAEDRTVRSIQINRQSIKSMRRDNNIGMFFSNLVMFFIILTSATVLYPKGITNIETIEQAAGALRPIAGDAAYLLFSIGIIGTGLLSIPILSGACGYIFAEVFGLKEGIDTRFNQSKGFYLSIAISILVGLGLNFTGINPVQALIYSAIIYGMTAPILIGIILHIGNNEKIMGVWRNKQISNILGFICLGLMSLAAITLVVVTFL